MGRSVSKPSGWVKVAYAAFSADDEYEAQFAFDEAVNDVRSTMMSRYPSLRRCNEWIGREDRAVLENDKCYVTVSEYCGLVALCSVPKGSSKKAADFCDKLDLQQAAGYFGDVLVSQGTFSNGEQIFAPASGVQKGAMGLGFTSKEGWL